MPKQTFFNLPDEKREHLIQLAVEELAANGYARFSISRYVAAAGIAKGSFYQYFDDKDDLYLHILDEMLVQRKMRVTSEEQPKLQGMNLTQFIRHLFRTVIAEFGRDPRLIAISMDYWRTRNDGLMQKIRDRYRGAEENYFPVFIRDEQARGDLDPAVDPEVLGQMLIGVFYYAGQKAVEGQTAFFDESVIERTVDQVEYILTHGIYNRTGNYTERD